MDGAVAGLYPVSARGRTYGYIADAQCLKYVQRIGQAPGVGQVVVADKKEYGYLVLDQTGDAFGEFALLGLRRVAALVGVAAKKKQAGAPVYAVVYYFVQGPEKVFKLEGQAAFRIGGTVAVYAQVKVGEVQYLYYCCSPAG